MKLFITILIVFSCSFAHSSESAPWGEAKESSSTYKPQKVMYDLTSGNINKIINILDRASLLNKLYNNDPFDSSIVIIIHGQSIPFFTKAQFKKYKKTITRAQNLTFGSNIEYRMCQASAKMQGFKPGDIHGFVKMVPMADAEIIKLHNDEGYAYIR